MALKKGQGDGRVVCPRGSFRVRQNVVVLERYDRQRIRLTQVDRRAD